MEVYSEVVEVMEVVEVVEVGNKLEEAVEVDEIVESVNLRKMMMSFQKLYLVKAAGGLRMGQGVVE